MDPVDAAREAAVFAGSLGKWLGRNNVRKWLFRVPYLPHTPLLRNPRLEKWAVLAKIKKKFAQLKKNHLIFV